MHRLLSFKQSVLPSSHHHLPTDTPPRHHRTAFTLPPSLHLQPPLRLSCNARQVTCSVLLTDHGEFRSTRVEFRTRNSLFNQPINHQNKWQLHSTRGLAPANVAVKGLILANVAVFLLWGIADEKFMMQNFMVQLENFNSGRYHTLITSAFSQYGVIHFVSNMLGLYLCGKSVEQRFGPKFLLTLYLVGAFVGSVSYLAHRAFQALPSKDNKSCESDRSKAAGHGASAAVLAIYMLDLLLTPSDISLFKLIIPTNVLQAGMCIWEDIERVKKDGRISGSAHLGGAVVGIIAWAWLRKGRL